jgi:exodeoxyribonuclease VII small subunit
MAKKEITYAEALAEIEAIVNQLEDGELDVDHLSDKVKRASELIKLCKTRLRSTKEEIDSILDDLDEE